MTWQIQPIEFISRPLPLSIAAERGPFIENARGGERLIVTLFPVSPRMRGFLADVIFDAIEQTLREQGAAAADRETRGDFSESLADAVYRAGLIGASGLALEIEDLSAIADSDNTLHPEDGQTLARWVAATEDHAVQLLLPPAVRALKIFPDPIPLSSILPLSARLSMPAMIEYPPLESAASASTEDEDAAPPSLLPPALDAFAADQEDDLSLEASDIIAREASDQDDEQISEQDSIDDGWVPSVLAETAEEAAPAISAPLVEASVTEICAPLAPTPVAEVEPVAAPEPVAQKAIAAQTFAHLRELEATRGPKPLSAIERLFSTAYLPLQRALYQGAAPSNAAAMLEEWSTSFAKSYKEAFEALKLRGRRPMMVMDLPETAHRLARLHGARNVQLLLVDGMGYDLGQRINQRLQTLLSQRAMCAESFMLWSGLPATTATQLELLGRGPNALREFTGEINDEMVVIKGRSASTIRRIRTGHRELYKLDLVEAMVEGHGSPVEQRLEEIVDAVTPLLASHIAAQPISTLVMLFGDHGFVLATDDKGNTTGVATPSARVEEVLTPAFAWFAGNVH